MESDEGGTNMIITVTLNPALDKTITVSRLTINAVNRAVETRLDPGGKGINVSKVLCSFGSKTIAMGILGGESGSYIKHQLDQMCIPNDFVISPHETRTNYKIVDRELHTVTDINESGEAVSDEILQAVWRKIDEKAASGDMVILAGTTPPGVPDDTMATWITHLKARGIRTCLDTSGMAMKLGVQALPEIIKPNKMELSELYGENLHYMRDIIAAAMQLAQSGIPRVVISLGEDGALFVTRDQVLRGHGVDVPVSSTVGSGDSFVAAIAHAAQKGMSWEETAHYAIAVSAANAMCSGTQPPTPSQVEQLLNRVVVDKL